MERDRGIQSQIYSASILQGKPVEAIISAISLQFIPGTKTLSTIACINSYPLIRSLFFTFSNNHLAVDVTISCPLIDPKIEFLYPRYPNPHTSICLMALDLELYNSSFVSLYRSLYSFLSFINFSRTLGAMPRLSIQT